MGNTLVKTQLKDVESFLVITIKTIEEFLNQTTLAQFDQGNESDLVYYKQILSNLRKLLVFSEEGLETCKIILQSDPFQKAAAEKTLYRIYHQCIVEFFSPKNDAWFEDSRSAYTGKNSIKFYKSVPEDFQQMVRGLESEFQRIREDLEYYETDYRTKIIQS
ncbi:YpuI family protein [Neobacillus sp. PS3-40]|uniref:YpuI family protein n=1 Tax=Neobacillus sp. PS3-40 TaxID=3070679 RepID=UPI0027E18BD6|nr:YpuI family protein [Neobacillus sp. PS3-40]WML45166.1 YpuI family protein [Neobacillus sp. PS3-40]